MFSQHKKSVLWDSRSCILWSQQGERCSPAKGAETMEYEFVWVRGHIEVFDGTGRFCFSADNEREAMEELNAA